jgi:hypothetical protein
MDQGRAYYALKSDALAKQQFEIVLSENPPELAKQTAEKYLAAIEERGKAKIDNLSAYAEFAFGRDSNVNASTSQGLLFVPALGATFTLSSTNVETASYYFSAAGGAEFTHVITPKFKVFIGGDINKRQTPDASAFTSGDIAVHAGGTYGEDDNNFSLSFQSSRFYLGGDPNRDTNGFLGQWKYTINPRFQFSLFGSYNLIRYDAAGLSSENINQVIGGAGWLYALDEAGKTLISTSVFAGNENDINHRADGGKSIHGARAALQRNIHDDLAVFGSIGLQNGDYDTSNVAFQQTRDDRQFDAAGGLSWRINDAWSLRPQLSYTKNNSNISLYKYDRTDVSVTLRWDYR